MNGGLRGTCSVSFNHLFYSYVQGRHSVAILFFGETQIFVILILDLASLKHPGMLLPPSAYCLSIVICVMWSSLLDS